MRESQSQMKAMAKDPGLNFEKLQERYTRNMFDVHLLVKWAGEQGRQTDMRMACFEAYFGRAENISDADVLAGCAENAGLDAKAARDVLASGQYANAVREDEAKYQQAGVSAVPAYVINQTCLVSGAQQPDTLVQDSTRKQQSGWRYHRLQWYPRTDGAQSRTVDPDYAR